MLKETSLPQNKGIFCISIDTELLWGRWDLNYQPFIARARKERVIIKNLLELFKKYNIPATWAIVGKLFTRPPKSTKNAKLWYAPDLIQMIREYPDQEIASHSFSHIIFNQCSNQQAENDIKNCVKVAREQGLKLTSFVFPRNKIGHLEILKKHGFTSFRGQDLRNWELLFHSTPPVYGVKIESGLVNIPGSMYFVSARGLKYFIPPGLRRFKAKLGIDKSIKEKKVFHLWVHPVDFTDNTESLFAEFEEILKYAQERINLKLLESKTMREIAKERLKSVS